MKLLYKLVLLVTFSILIAISYDYTKKSIAYKYKKPNIEQMVKAKLKNGFIDIQIQRAIKNKNFDEVQSYISLSKQFNIKLQPDTKELIKQNNTTTKKIKRSIKNFINGFLSGKAQNKTEVAGAITSDFTLYGDLRDINIQGQKYINNQPYDKLILGLSMVGLALSASEFITFGASSSLKIGTSALKIAKREKVLTKNFSKFLVKTFDKSINFKSLKNIKFSSLKEVKKSTKIIKNSVNLKQLKPIFKNLRTIKKSTSVADTVSLLKYVDNSKDLKAVAKLSKKYKSATKGIFKLLGKNTFRLVKSGIKWSKNFILSIMALLFSIYGFLLTITKIIFPKNNIH